MKVPERDPMRDAGKVFMLVLLIVLAPLAGAIAFFTVCFGTAVAGAEESWAWGLGTLAGVAAVASIVGFVIRLPK
jgi:hypothetical protein